MCQKAGVTGIFTYEEAIIRLTIHLVKDKRDPFTFQFDIVKEPVTDISEEFETEPKLLVVQYLFLVWLMMSLLKRKILCYQ